jgi:hypothetical protein
MHAASLGKSVYVKRLFAHVSHRALYGAKNAQVVVDVSSIALF